MNDREFCLENRNSSIKHQKWTLIGIIYVLQAPVPLAVEEEAE
jgi:hypothetical protein